MCDIHDGVNLSCAAESILRPPTNCGFGPKTPPITDRTISRELAPQPPAPGVGNYEKRSIDWPGGRHFPTTRLG